MKESLIRAVLGWRLFLVALLAGMALHPVLHAADAPVRIRVVGGLGGGNLYPRFEEPFWKNSVPKLTGGQLLAEIVPFDKSGLRASEVLRLVKLGVVPYGTMLMSGIRDADPELAAVDLAGMNPDMATLRKSVAAFRPHLEKVMRERHGIEVLAVYTSPAQITFCTRPFVSLADLAGRRIRISNPTQADLIRPFGAVPVQLEFSQVVDNMSNGNVDCAITAGMTANTIGLLNVATHVHPSAITWGLSVFGVNKSAWNGLPENIRNVLKAELPKLEASIWADAEIATQQGVACNVGRAQCTTGKKGQMKEVGSNAEDDARLRKVFREQVLGAWIGRCGRQCESVWNTKLAPVTNIKAAKK